MDAIAATNTDFSLTVLGSGSSGNCSLVSSGETHILIDAGFSAKEIGKRMTSAGYRLEQLSAVLVTHEHADHVQSVHTLSHRLKIPIFATQGTFAAAIQGKRFFDWQEILPGRGFDIGPLAIHPVTLPHDAADPVGFRIECGGRTLGHITDFGYTSGLVKESLKGCDSLLIEANHDLEMLKDGPYPWSLKQRIASRLGHLSNEAMLEMLPEILHEGVGNMILAHMSATNNDRRLLTLQIKRVLRRIGLPALPFTIAKQEEPLATVRV